MTPLAVGYIHGDNDRIDQYRRDSMMYGRNDKIAPNEIPVAYKFIWDLQYRDSGDVTGEASVEYSLFTETSNAGFKVISETPLSAPCVQS